MANSFRKDLVTGISKPNRLGLAAPIGIVPMSMHQAPADKLHGVRELVLVDQVRLKFQAAKHGAQQVIGYLHAVCDGLANRLGLSEQGFGLRRFHFHDSTVGRWAVN